MINLTDIVDEILEKSEPMKLVKDVQISEQLKYHLYKKLTLEENIFRIYSEGYKYSGRGMTQITFKGNYEKANKNFAKYNLPYDLISNPEVLKTNEDADVALLVIGKLEGQFGNKLKPGVNYSSNPAAIIATQDGGKRVPSAAPLEVYTRALNAVLNTKWIQDLIG